MRLSRAKFIRKYLRFYRVIFNLVPQYNIILDGNFIFAALKYKLDIRERLQKLLQNEGTRLFILKTSLDELESLGEKAKMSVDFAKVYCEIIDDSDIVGENTIEKVLSTEILYINGKNIRQAFWAFEDYHVIFRDGEKMMLLETIAVEETLMMHLVVVVVVCGSVVLKLLSRQWR